MYLIKFLARALFTISLLSAGIVSAAPTVSITSPANNATFVAPASITINANAAASGSTVSKVDFYNGPTKIGTDTTSPYSFAWTNVAVGTYTVTVKATDSAGAVTTSAAITVKVNANVAPTVSITAPVNNAAFAAPAAIMINANAADTDGTIVKVDFYNGTTLLGSDTTSPYSYSWTNVAVGTYSITAKATDDKGAVTTSTAVSVKVNANQAPTVSVTAPANNATFTAPAAINITANAADADGTITKIDFYNGTTLLGTDTTSPYSYSWASVAAGTYSITAKATDNLGAVTTSAAINVTVGTNKPPTVSITAPANNATFTAPAAITINATAADTDGTITKVEFYNGTTLLNSDTTSPYSYSWANIAAGTYSITAKATDNLGAVTISAAISVTVGSNQAPVVRVTAPVNNATFTAPATVNITATATDADGTITKVEFFNGATLLGTATTSPFSFNWTNVVLGTYSIKAKATDNAGTATTSAITTIKVVGNQAPIIDFNEPVIDPAVPIVGPTDIKLGVIASDPDGTIAKVEYSYQVVGFTDVYKIGEAFIAPYRVVWKNASGNSFSPNPQIKLSAIATDNSGAKTTAVKSFSLTTNFDLAQISFQMQGLEFIDQAVYSSTQSLFPTILFSPFEGRAVQRAQIYANTTLLCEITDALEISKGRLTCNATTYPACSYLINARVTMTNGTITSKAAGTIYVQATPVAGVTITKPSEGAKLWPGRLDIEGDITLPTGALFKLYAGFGKCTGTTTSVLYEEKIIEIPATIVGSRFTATHSYDKSASLPPCVKAVVVGTDGKNSQDLRHTDFLKSSVTFVNTPTTIYTPTVDLEVVATLPPPSATTRVEIVGVVAAFNGTSYKASVPLQVGTNQIVAIAYDGTTAIVSGGATINYIAPLDRILDAYLGPSALNTALPVALSEIKVSGTVSVAPETTVMIRDAQGTTRFAVIRAYGAFEETITAYPGYNEIVVTAYGPGGLSATKTLSFVNFALGDTPSVVITSPQSCSVISTQPTTVNIAADTFGAFNPVMFKSNGASIGTANANPVANFTYSNVQSGSYALTASFDYNLAPVNSKAVNFTVNLANASHTCSLVSPQNNARYALGSSIPLEATASATTGSISRVEFYDNTTLLASVTAAPYRDTWTTASNGAHTIYVKATNNSGITVNCATAQLQVSANFGPVVTLPNPPSGTVFIEGGGAIITPTLSDNGGTINKVQLWRGTTLLNEQTTAPFKFTLTNLVAGSYTLFARAFDNQGAISADSNSITFQVSVPPTISLNTPANSSIYTAPATIPISVSASVPDGTIQRVEISSNGSVIATLTSAPFTFNWTNVPAGSYALTANAFSNWGASLEAVLQPKRDVVVYAPTQVGTVNVPKVTLTAPANNSTVGTPVTLTVNAQNIAGTIATIEFLDDANQIIGYNINAASSNYTLNYVWTNPTSGSHTITAKVKNSAGVTFTSAAVTVQISAAPTINLSAAGSFYLAPANVDLVIGTTVSAAGATLSRVEIYSSVVTGGSSGTPTLVTTLSAPPYRYRLTNLAVGTYNITARAVDSLGNSSDSAPLEIRVGTAYGIVLPATLNGSTINGNTLSFIATINSLANSSVTVNGVNATVSRDGRIVVNGLVLTAGVNTITITVTPPTGAVLTQTFTVTRAATPPSFNMTVSPTQGAAPLLSLVEVKNLGNTPFATELLSCDNPSGNVALAENQSTTLAGALECRYTKPGVYQPWAAIKDASGAVIWSSTNYVVVSGALDGLSVVRMVYSNMLDQLKAGNANGALGFLSGDAKTKYSAIFTALGTDLATIAGRLGAISTTTASDGVAEVVLTRDVNGVKQVFSIHLLRGEDGVWRIESM